VIDPWGGPEPRWFTISAHRPFLADLARGIWSAMAGHAPEQLSEVMVLLPTRRAVRGLADAFRTVTSGAALLPPQMRAIGDLDAAEPPFEPADLALDLPAAVSVGRRRFELAGLVTRHSGLLDRQFDAATALRFAEALAELFDGIAVEELGEDVDLAAAVDGDFAAHWLSSVGFLEAVRLDWRKRLAELGLQDLAVRRVALIRALENRWRVSPPTQKVIAAGSTGSTKATAGLLAAIAASPTGVVVLPGLDQSLADAAWAAVDDQHPQASLKRLLQASGVGRQQVKAWPGSAEAIDRPRWRRRLINEALRPAASTSDWLNVIEDLRQECRTLDPIAEGLAGLTVVEASDEEEGAAAAALLLREVLETSGRTAALVTPDAGLARRVEARLTRWGVTGDSSVGRSLAASVPAALARSLASAAVDGLDAVVLLSIAKHPLADFGMTAETLAEGRLEFERHGLRGPPPRSWDELANRLSKAGDPAKALAGRVRQAVELAAAPFAALATAEQAAKALVGALDAVAGEGLWRGQAGARLAAVFAGLIEDTDSLPPVTASGFAQLFDGLLEHETVRAGGATHPRLAILGVLEARLVAADLVILAGLEEGMWPAGEAIDPFLSRPMRARLGLPPPERRIGLAAHDFAQGACAAEVVLLHIKRRAGAPTTPSRWLWRLRTLVEGAGLVMPDRPQLLDWARALDAPLANPPASLTTAQCPRPTPPLAARPRAMAVTTVETWVRDPYSLYARRILGLEALDRPGAAADARARGSAIHAALENFVKAWPDALPTDAAAILTGLIVTELERAGLGATALVRERILAERLGPELAALEARRRPGRSLHVEQWGRLSWTSAGGEFTLSARADRIEIGAEGAAIVDYKTGVSPTAKQVSSGLSPQLSLTAAILEAGGFAGLPARAGDALVYIEVRGASHGVAERPVDKGEAQALAAAALDRLKRRVEAFDEPATAYPSRAAMQFARQGGDFDHLARFWEWGVIDDPEAES
jgi:ATP-dependent helicase/nuclease subunit B